MKPNCWCCEQPVELRYSLVGNFSIGVHSNVSKIVTIYYNGTTNVSLMSAFDLFKLSLYSSAAYSRSDTYFKPLYLQVSVHIFLVVIWFLNVFHIWARCYRLWIWWKWVSFHPFSAEDGNNNAKSFLYPHYVYCPPTNRLEALTASLCEKEANIALMQLTSPQNVASNQALDKLRTERDQLQAQQRQLVNVLYWILWIFVSGNCQKH